MQLLYSYIYIQFAQIAGAFSIAELLTTHYLLGRRAWRAKTALKNNRIGKVAT